MRASVIVPAYQAETSIGAVVHGLVEHWPEPGAVIVVDDGSTDETGARAEEAGALVLKHQVNLGKGTALRTGLRHAENNNYDVAISVDADGQHPPSEAWRLHQACNDANAIVIGVRDLAAAGAPENSQWSNAFSDRVLSLFTGRQLDDTQCGLRRYPVKQTLALNARAKGYAYEAEVLIRAVAANMRIEHHAVTVIYPPEEDRISHFHNVRDPTRIVVCVVSTVVEERCRALFGKRQRNSTSTPNGTAHDTD